MSAAKNVHQSLAKRCWWKISVETGCSLLMAQFGPRRSGPYWPRWRGNWSPLNHRLVSPQLPPPRGRERQNFWAWPCAGSWNLGQILQACKAPKECLVQKIPAQMQTQDTNQNIRQLLYWCWPVFLDNFAKQWTLRHMRLAHDLTVIPQDTLE